MKLPYTALLVLSLAACSTDGASRFGYDVLRGAEDYRCNQAMAWEDYQACKGKLPPPSYDDYKKSTAPAGK